MRLVYLTAAITLTYMAGCVLMFEGSVIAGIRFGRLVTGFEPLLVPLILALACMLLKWSFECWRNFRAAAETASGESKIPLSDKY